MQDCSSGTLTVGTLVRYPDEVTPHRSPEPPREEFSPSAELELILGGTTIDPLVVLQAVGRLQSLLSDAEDMAVLRARAADLSWAQIAEAVGRSKQAVWEKHRPDSNPWVERKRSRLMDLGTILDRLAPYVHVQGLRPEDQHDQDWFPGIELLRRALSAFPPDELPRCRILCREGGRRVDERSLLGEAIREVRMSLESLQPLVLTAEDLRTLRTPRIVIE